MTTFKFFDKLHRSAVTFVVYSRNPCPVPGLVTVKECLAALLKLPPQALPAQHFDAAISVVAE